MAKFVKIGSSGQLQEETSVGVSAGAADANKLVHLDSSGKLDSSLVQSTPTAVPDFWDPYNYRSSYYFPSVSGLVNYIGPQMTFNGTTSNSPGEYATLKWPYVYTATTTTAGTVAGSRTSFGYVWFNSFFDVHFCFTTSSISSAPTSATKLFVGLIGAFPNGSPFTSTNNYIGLIKDVGETGFYMRSRGTGSITTNDIGVSNFPATTANMCFYLNLKSTSSTTCSYTVKNWTTSSSITGSINTNLPVSGVFPVVSVDNGTDAAVRSIQTSMIAVKQGEQFY